MIYVDQGRQLKAMRYVYSISSLGVAMSNIRGRALLRPKVLLPVTALALLTALLFPLLGPLVDHHFAERQPGHVHLYLTGAPSQHLHHHEAFHTHDTPAADPAEIEAGGPVLENSVIFMPQESEGLSVSSIGVTLALLTTAVAITLPTFLMRLSPRNPQTLRGLTFHPEPPPPRLAL